MQKPFLWKKYFTLHMVGMTCVHKRLMERLGKQQPKTKNNTSVFKQSFTLNETEKNEDHKLSTHRISTSDDFS